MKLNVAYAKVTFTMFTFTYLMPRVGCIVVCCSLHRSRLRLYHYFSFDLVFQIAKHDGFEFDGRILIHTIPMMKILQNPRLDE